MLSTVHNVIMLDKAAAQLIQARVVPTTLFHDILFFQLSLPTKKNYMAHSAMVCLSDAL
jgi:hypothetical protein